MADEDDVDIIGDEAQSPSAVAFNDMRLTMNELLPYLGSNSWLMNSDQVYCMESSPEIKTTTVDKRKTITGRETKSKRPNNRKKPLTNQEKQLFNKRRKQSTKLDNLITESDPSKSDCLDTSKPLISSIAEIEVDPLVHSTNSKADDLLTKNSREIIRITKEVDSSECVDVDIEDFMDSSTSDMNEQIVRPLELVTQESDMNMKCDVNVDDVQRISSCTLAVELEDEPVVTFPKPNVELTLERNVILDVEKTVNQEFFEGRPQKTPERYLKIRNYILDTWMRCRPSYLNKTSVRPGLKNCGDVNCIGRIHAYLEQIGAINFGCDQTAYNRPLVVPGRPTSIKSTQTSVSATIIKRTDVIRPRKRKIPVPMLCYDSTVGGYTMTHDESGQIVDISDSSDKFKAERRSKNPKTVDARNNPFRLISCSEFSSDASSPAPFTVQVDVKALIMMDIHAHLSELEVIGLLGGSYDRNNAVLNLTTAEPCDSLNSTGSECEMDPVSQTQASERLQHSGLNVIGWYHSHPTFSPNPSLRDLETQSKFQEWFGQGGSPFVGVIISPRHLCSTSGASIVRYMIVGDETVQPDNYRKPYKFSPTFSELGHDLSDFITDIERLIKKCMPSVTSHSSLPIMNKLISSIHNHLIDTQEDQTNVPSLLCEIGSIIASHMPINPTSPNRELGQPDRNTLILSTPDDQSESRDQDISLNPCIIDSDSI